MSKTAFVVDDSRVARVVLGRLLRSHGYEVIELESAEAALEHLATDDNPELIFMDMMMPEMNGIEATVQIKADLTTKDIPIVICTGHSDVAAERVASLAAGALDLVSKPPTADELEAVFAAIQPGLGLTLEEKMPIAPPIMEAETPKIVAPAVEWINAAEVIATEPAELKEAAIEVVAIEPVELKETAIAEVSATAVPELDPAINVAEIEAQMTALVARETKTAVEQAQQAAADEVTKALAGSAEKVDIALRAFEARIEPALTQTITAEVSARIEKEVEKHEMAATMLAGNEEKVNTALREFEARMEPALTTTITAAVSTNLQMSADKVAAEAVEKAGKEITGDMLEAAKYAVQESENKIKQSAAEAAEVATRKAIESLVEARVQAALQEAMKHPQVGQFMQAEIEKQGRQTFARQQVSIEKALLPRLEEVLKQGVQAKIEKGLEAEVALQVKAEIQDDVHAMMEHYNEQTINPLQKRFYALSAVVVVIGLIALLF